MVTSSTAGFSVAEAARRVGVASSTLRTWERRYGVQPSVRTAGGHRRYSIDDVASLQRLQRLVEAGMPTGTAAGRLWPATTAPEHRDVDAIGDVDTIAAEADGTGEPGTGADGLRARFAAAAGGLDLVTASRLATQAVAELGVVDAWTRVFVPHLQAAGEHWECHGDGVEREHLATAAIQFALVGHHLAGAAPDAATRVLAVATPEEGHTLPLDALAAAAGEAGLPTAVLGTLPPEAVHAAVADLAPSVVVLWSRSRSTADRRLLRSLVARVPVVCAAGPGWSPGRLPDRIPHVDDLPGALAALRAWVG